MTQTSENKPFLLPIADLRGEIEKLQKELVIERDRHLRSLADFTNYRRRMERDGNKLADAGKREILLPLLTIVDDLEKALQWSADSEEPVVQGVRIIHKKFLALLEALGVLPFESIGVQYDHERHEAIAITNHDGSKPGIVIDELRRGYFWNSELLRAAQVRVGE